MRRQAKPGWTQGWGGLTFLLTRLVVVTVGLCWQLTEVEGAPAGSQRPGSGDFYTDLDTEGCDWTVWDTPGAARGVRSLRAECGEGHIDWRSPYGALRVVLTPPTPHIEFEACFRITTHYAKVKVSIEHSHMNLNHDITDGTAPQRSSLAELVILGGKSVESEGVSVEVGLPVGVAGDAGVTEEEEMEREACLPSPQGEVVTLYLETDPSQAAAVVGHVRIEYDISRSRDNNLLQDCRPCTEDEILQAACSSDFAIAGEMKRVENIPDAEETRIDVLVSSILRERLPLFRITDSVMDQTRMNSHKHFPGVDPLTTDSEGVLKEKRGGSQYGGSVWVPDKCGVRRGPGQFVFLGRIRLKRALLQCAPRSDEFTAIWRTATDEGRTPCTLS